MCNEWAHLEQWVTRLFLAIGGWDYRIRTAIPMSTHIDIRDQIRASKIGATLRCPHGSFLNSTIECLDYVDNQLRTARNRYVHDIWASADDGQGAMRVNITPKISIAPGSGVREVRHWENVYVDIEEVREVIADIVDERIYLAELVKCFQNPQDVLLPAQLSAPPRRRHLLRQQERQRQKDKAGATPKPPRKS